MSRRGHGEGSIFKRQDGLWAASVRYTGGTRVSKTSRRKTVVDRWVRARLAEREAGLTPQVGKELLGSFVEGWFDAITAKVGPRTLVRYRELMRLHVLPKLGGRSLASLTAQDIQELHGRLLGRGLSPQTVVHVHRALRKALQDAVNWGKLARNVCTAVKAPRVPAQEMRVLSPDQARRFLAAAAGEPLEALYVLAVSTGLRQGELLGLKWSDVDLDASRLQIRRTVQRVVGEGIKEGEPKSTSGRRSVALTPMATSALRRHRSSQLEQRMAAPTWTDLDLMFTNKVGLYIEPGNLTQRSFRPLLRRADVPQIRFHDLRHTAATLLLTEGVHPKIVQEMLGHSTVKLTLDRYSHVTPNLQVAAADRMEAVLSGGQV